MIFWGRYTPLAPQRPQGGRTIHARVPDERLHFDWEMLDTLSQVNIQLIPDSAGTRLSLVHSQIPVGFPIWMEDFWFLSLENLRRHLDGKTVDRFDFSAIQPGPYSHTLGVDAPPEAVWRALTEPGELERWIASRAQVEPEREGKYSYGWPVPGPVRILVLEPGRRLSTQWASWEREPASVVTWELEGSGGKTRLTIVHSGFADDFDSSGTQVGWLNFMNWLRSSVEYGPSWVPPLSRLSEEMLPYYPASIAESQGELGEY
jgi:uncharacterized protein YndB with AHSA1/START domain